MFKKLFGSSSGSAKPQAQAPVAVDSQATIERLDNQIESLKLRSKKIENDMKTKIQEALAKKKAKDQRGKIQAQSSVENENIPLKIDMTNLWKYN